MGGRFSEQRRPADRRQPVGEYEDQNFLTRTQPLMDELNEQLAESERVLAHYNEQPDVPYAMRQPRTDAGPSANEPPIPETPRIGEEVTPEPGALPARPFGSRGGFFGPSARPAFREAGAPRFGPQTSDTRAPVRPSRPVTRGGGATREPVRTGGGNTAIRFQEPPTGFSMLSGGGSGGSAGPGLVQGLANQGVPMDEMRRLFMRLRGR